MEKRTVCLPENAPRGLCLAVVADLHNTCPAGLAEALVATSPDAVLVPGDVVHGESQSEKGLAFLRECAAQFPTFCSLGNHEFRTSGDIRAEIAATGAVLLDNTYVRTGNLVIGGLTSGFDGRVQGRFRKTPPPKTDWLDGFCAEVGYRILLSHHPEYFKFLKDWDIDLIVSGHAHGGQWRFFGHGVFAPGQGLFPRYTSGFYGGKMFVSRGLSNNTRIPRLGNREELIFLTSDTY